MMKTLQNIHPIFFLVAATILEATGDAIIRKCLYNYTGPARMIYAIIGALLLTGYGFLLNLAPVEFGRIVGLYIATLFIVWQFVNYISFKAVPTLPVIVGGSLVVIGGLIITFWKNDQ